MCPSTETLNTDPVAFRQDWNLWHERHEKARADAHGFLAVTSLNFLDEQPREIAGIPGRYSATDAVVTVELQPHEQLSLAGRELNPEAVGSTTVLDPIPERGGLNLDAGNIRIEVARRGGHILIRPRDPEFPFLAAYTGTESFAPNPEFALIARVEELPEPETVTVGSVAEGIEHVYQIPALLHFELGGQEHVLKAFNGHAPGSLTVLFTDGTSGKSTYAANRSLSIEPRADGTAVVDFNRATNLPCAYTDFATCPLPPAGNRLPLDIEAGEKKPNARVEGV